MALDLDLMVPQFCILWSDLGQSSHTFWSRLLHLLWYLNLWLLYIFPCHNHNSCEDHPPRSVLRQVYDLTACLTPTTWPHILTPTACTLWSDTGQTLVRFWSDSGQSCCTFSSRLLTICFTSSNNGVSPFLTPCITSLQKSACNLSSAQIHSTVNNV